MANGKSAHRWGNARYSRSVMGRWKERSVGMIWRGHWGGPASLAVECSAACVATPEGPGGRRR
eukprot:6877130-Lingulodinium_polyedra.AAC.1